MLDADGTADLKAGKIDPRIVGVLTKLSQEHKITVSSMASDHSKFTSGGSVSNHLVGRGLDIAAIDDQIVGPGSPLAREVASELAELDPSIRPSEIGSPFAISGPGFFTDAAHQNHIHVGFDEALPADFKLPAELAAGAAPPARLRRRGGGRARGGGPVAPAAAAPAAPAAPRRRSARRVCSPRSRPATAPRPHRAKGAGDSGIFARVDDPQPPAAGCGRPPADRPRRPPDLADAPTDYPGDDAPREQLAAWMAAEAKKRGIPPQLPSWPRSSSPS